MARSSFVVIVLWSMLPSLVTCGCLDDVPGFKVLKLTERQAAGLLWNIGHDIEIISNSQIIHNVFYANDSLYLTQPFDLDGEKNQDLCSLAANGLEFQIRCKDTSQTTIEVAVQVDFLDDFPPTINDSYIAHIAEEQESGVGVIQFQDGVDVTDMDCGTDQFYFTIQSLQAEDEGVFGMNQATHEVFSNSTLDYERTNIYTLNISVLSRSPFKTEGKNAFTTLTVLVDDVDDRDPMFVSPVFELTVNEGAFLSSQWFESTPAILAFDGDTGINQTLKYTISDVQPDSDIVINETNGQIKINANLDRENTSIYLVTIKASQIDKTYKSAEALLTVHVQDVNDHLPEFSTLHLAVNMQENSPDGTWIVALPVTDLDEGDNAKNQLSITTDDCNAFDLKQPMNGGLFWLVVNDTDALKGKTTCHLTIHATPITSLVENLSCDYKTTCVTFISVNILDMNDDRPRFDKEMYIFQAYKPGDGLTVGNISVNGHFAENDNSQVIFSLSLIPEAKKCDGIFDINDLSGEITMIREIYQSGLCLFQAKACVNKIKNQQLCSVVPVTIELATMATTYNLRIKENIPVGTLVLVLPERKLEINSDSFEIKANRLVTKAVLDRETKAIYNLSLTEDNTNNLVSSIVIRIDDVNDNSPIPGKLVYTVKLTGLEADGEKIVSVKAVDRDEGPNGDVSYSLLNGREWFRIGAKSGDVSLTKMPSIDREGGRMDVFINVQDNGNPPLKTVVKIEISFPSANTTTPLVLPITRDQVNQDLDKITSTLSSILDLSVTIVKVDHLADVREIGSILFLKAHWKNGTETPSGDLKRLLAQHAQQIYNTFHDDNDDDDDGDTKHLYQILFIITTGLSVIFLLLLIVTCRHYRTRSKKTRHRMSIMATLNKDTKLYDETGKDNFTFVKNGGSSVRRSNGNSLNGSNITESNFVNPTFVDDDYENVQSESDTYAKITKNGSIRNVYPNNESQSSANLCAEVAETSMEDNSSVTESTPTQTTKELVKTTDHNQTNSTPTKPYISTITIERPQRSSSRATYKNLPLNRPRNIQNDDAPSSSNNNVEMLDSDSGFPFDKDGQDEDGSSSTMDNTPEDEFSSVSSGDGKMPIEPEPDYSKLVRFGKSDEIVDAKTTSSNTDQEEYDPSTFYFLESAATAL